jgi:hypothetical protein
MAGTGTLLVHTGVLLVSTKTSLSQQAQEFEKVLLKSEVL